MSHPAKLWLVRHAQPLVAPGVCYGRLDVSADPVATERCAESLAALLPPGIRVQHSTLQRCELLSKYLKGMRPDLTMHPDDNLRETDFGHWEGQHWDAIGQMAVDAWVADFPHHRPGGGESAQQVLQRVGAALIAITAQMQADGRDAVWLTHAGVIRAAKLWLAGTHMLRSASDWPRDAPECGAWLCLMPGASTTIHP